MQTITFSNVVDMVRHLSLDERKEMEDIIKKSIIEERRNEIYQSCLESEQEYKKGGMKSSSNIKELKAMLK